MAVPGDHVYSIRKVSLIFAVAAAALLASLLWWVKVDYQRPWRRWQHRFIDIQAALTRADALTVQSPEYRKELTDARAALAAATARLEAQEGKALAELQTRAETIRGDQARAELTFNQLRAELGVAQARYEQLRVAAGADDPATDRAWESLHRLQDAFDQAKLQRDQLGDERTAIERQQEDLNREVTDARRKLHRLEAERDETLRKERELSSKLNRTLLNLPLFDFLAPKGTRGRTEIKEVVLPDVQLDLHFVRTYRTDRCMTCHVGIDDERFTEEHLATLNRDRATRGEPPLQVGQPLLAHPDLDLFVSADSPHPMSRMGCTVCHEGNGEETDFVLAGHTPNSPAQRREWAQKYYVRRASLVPEHSFRSAEKRVTQPIVPPKYAGAGCTKCHAKVADIAISDTSPAGRRINKGRFSFTSLGCANCHLDRELRI